jgi:hypothetical protein
MAEHNYDLAGIRLRIQVGEPVYSSEKILRVDKDGYEIVKRWNEGKKINEARYSYMKEGKEIVYIRGIYDTTKSFHISRIENVLKDKSSGEHIPAVFFAMESDLKEHGVTHITTNALARLAPILVKRYGFDTVEGKSIAQVHGESSNKIPGKAFPLEKYL